MRILLIIGALILTDLYYFPIETTLLPGVNSKMMLALVGLGLFVLKTTSQRLGMISKDMLQLNVWALVISLCSYLSMVYNNTIDPSFLTYFLSMWVWLAGAYAVVAAIRAVHGCLSVELVCHYLIGACVLQCALALLLDNFPVLDQSISPYLAGEKFMGGEDTGDRLHGIGCALDVGAIRISAVLVMLAYWVVKKRETMTNVQAGLYTVSFLTLAVVGNMIGRTVTVGAGVALVYWVFQWVRGNYSGKMFRSLVIMLFIFIPILTIGYHTNNTIRHHLRFGFEGFFSLYEKGYWETGSNNILKEMVIFPDNAKTWIIGDGYGANPADKNSQYFDPYYLGKQFHGYYMQTDIGYLRYIYYFGLIGLMVFIGYFLTVGKICMKNLQRHKPLFLLLLAINFLVWFKVSTDIFLAFAPFLCLSKEEEEARKEDVAPKDNSNVSEIA